MIQRTQLIVEYEALNKCYQVYVQWDRRALELMTGGAGRNL